MMTARQYASKYPGQKVKLKAKVAAELGLEVDQPIGIIVGFKTGKLGVIGSSKVAIYRDTLGIRYELGPRTDTKYQAVVPDPPASKNGMYYLSVEQLELVSPPKALKKVNPYPNKCEHCGAPSRIGNGLTLCSNFGCKSTKAALKALGPFPKIFVVNKQGYVLCPTCQTDVLTFLDAYSNNHKSLVCAKKHTFHHNWREGQKMNHNGSHRYIHKNGKLEQFRG